MKWIRSPFTWFLLALVIIGGLVSIGPEEASLGEHVRIVYLHGAWALSAEACFCLAGLAGLAGILWKRRKLHAWSAALGQTGIIFWIIYLPISLWAMQSNWNGLFLGEPRFRAAFILAVTGALLQAGLLILGRPVVTSLINVLFFSALWILLRNSDYVLHPPPSPIFGSDNFVLQLYFIVLIFATLTAAWFLTHWWLRKNA
jgi:hypothetical protein